MRTIIKAIVRILALVFALKLLGSLISNIGSMATMSTYDREYFLIYLATALFSIIILGLVIYFGWWKADRIAKLLAGDLDENAIAISTSNVDLYRVIISAFGIYLLITSIPGLAALISYHVYNAQIFSDVVPAPELVANEIQRWVLQAVTFLLGIWLTFGSKPIARFLVRISSSESNQE
jgi:hypothetical protein